MHVDLPSTKPYLIRAIHEWCCDNGFTPYITVIADERTRVPVSYTHLDVYKRQVLLDPALDGVAAVRAGCEILGGCGNGCFRGNYCLFTLA